MSCSLKSLTGKGFEVKWGGVLLFNKMLIQGFVFASIEKEKKLNKNCIICCILNRCLNFEMAKINKK